MLSCICCCHIIKGTFKIRCGGKGYLLLVLIGFIILSELNNATIIIYITVEKIRFLFDIFI